MQPNFVVGLFEEIFGAKVKSKTEKYQNISFLINLFSLD